MALIDIDVLVVGMVLAEDLFTPKGRLVLAEGAALQQEHLKILKSWGIYEVNIADSSLDEDFIRRQELTAGQNERAEAYLWRRFAFNELDKEPIATIYRHAVRRFSQSLAQGWDPLSFAAADLPCLEEEKNAPLSVAQLLQGKVELVSLPTVYTRIVDALNDPEATSHKIAEAISKDANLTVRLLRLVNSPVFGFSGKIDSIPRAVSLLGTDELTSLVLGVTVVNQFANISSDLLNMDAFWRHSIRCGLFAKYLAEQIGEAGTEKYFAGGLLHDIGRLIMLDRMSFPYRRAIRLARAEHQPMYLAEQECLQTDHGIVGKLLVMRWRLPPPLQRMIGGHHAPHMQHHERDCCLMHVADLLAHAFGHEQSLVNEIPPLQEKAWEVCGLSADALIPIIRQVDEEFSGIVRVFFG